MPSIATPRATPRATPGKTSVHASPTVQLVSDVHAEHGPHAMPDPDDIRTNADIVVFAGDVDTASRSMDTACGLAGPDAAVIAIAGNHEHYGTGLTLDQAHALMRAKAVSISRQRMAPFMFLEDEEAVLDVRGVAVRVLGCTLWTNCALFGNPVMHELAVMGLKDYQRITGQDAEMQTGNADMQMPWHVDDAPAVPFTVSESRARHARSRAFLEEALSRPHDGPTLVVTHHLPSMRSVMPHYRSSAMSAGFASNLDELVGMDSIPPDGQAQRRAVTLWMHGHTHSSAGWRHRDGAFVACNPMGYPLKGRRGDYIRGNPHWNPNLLIRLSRQGDGQWRALPVRDADI